MHNSVPALLPPDAVSRLRDRLLVLDYSVDGLAEELGWSGWAALTRGDLAGAERATRTGSARATTTRLFMLGRSEPSDVVEAALGAGLLAELSSAGLLEAVPAGWRATLDLRPYAEADDPLAPGRAAPATGGDWWVLSDFGADVRQGPVATDHVLGIGSAALTLAQATVRTPAHRALDIGTGCGVQALHLSRHTEHVVATDLSHRALRMAATVAALNGLDWDLRQGDLLAPVAGERFDQIVANPPFVVGPGPETAGAGFDYRDSGLVGDEVSARLVRGLPDLLADGGTAQLLANWALTSDEEWQERLGGWLAGSQCDAWVWQREVADPGEYIALWLRDAGLTTGTDSYNEEYDRWADWFSSRGVLGVGMGLVSLRRVGIADPVVVCEDVPQPVQQPIGPEIGRWFDRAAWLRRHDDDTFDAAVLRLAPDAVLVNREQATVEGWSPALTHLTLGSGLRWEIECDDALAAVAAGFRVGARLGDVLDLLAGARGLDPATVRTAVRPTVRDLVARGVLLPD